MPNEAILVVAEDKAFQDFLLRLVADAKLEKADSLNSSCDYCHRCENGVGRATQRPSPRPHYLA
jgi:hypothetical protein